MNGSAVRMCLGCLCGDDASFQWQWRVGWCLMDELLPVMNSSSEIWVSIAFSFSSFFRFCRVHSKKSSTKTSKQKKNIAIEANNLQFENTPTPFQIPGNLFFNLIIDQSHWNWWANNCCCSNVVFGTDISLVCCVCVCVFLKNTKKAKNAQSKPERRMNATKQTYK